MFEGRKLIIGTKHKKENVIAPLLENNLGVTCFTPEYFDTDILGTFTGEIERKENPLITLRNKCLLAAEKYDCDLVVASEGSFGPDPSIFFVNADDEMVMFLDKKNDLEIVAREITTTTNFNGCEIKSEGELKEFAQLVLFPSHALILRNAKNSNKNIIKGITDWGTLITSYHEMVKVFGSAYCETDMRALYNPTRMKVIEKATVKLIEKIKSLCPRCGIPGFGISEVKQGLPCSLCQSPTRSTLSFISICSKCNYSAEIKYPHQKFSEDPMYCDVCNP